MCGFAGMVGCLPLEATQRRRPAALPMTFLDRPTRDAAAIDASPKMLVGPNDLAVLYWPKYSFQVKNAAASQTASNERRRNIWVVKARSRPYPTLKFASRGSHSW